MSDKKSNQDKNIDLTSIKSKLSNLYTQLSGINKEDKGSQEKIESIESQIKEFENKGVKYEASQGIIEDQNDSEKRRSAESKGKDSKEYLKWQKEQQQKDITGNQWYNSEQVKLLTGKDVAVGEKQFIESLKNNKDGAFTYLKIPNENNKSLNHFVSVQKKGNTITFVDSNGDLISQSDRKAIKQALGDNVKINYLNKEGESISEEEAITNPKKIFSPQLDKGDDCSCGFFSARTTDVLNNSKNIPEDLKKVYNLDISEERKKDQKSLNSGLSLKVSRQVDNISFPTKSVESNENNFHRKNIDLSGNSKVR